MRFPLSVRVACATLVACAGAAHAGDLVVNIPGPLAPAGQVGCGLFSGAAGFPTDNSAARMQWVAPQAGGVTCTFSGVADGTYAVSVLHDLNGNQRVDSNFLGIPLEPWGVSANVRPALRAPRFDEAAFKVEGGQAVTLQIRVGK